MGWCGGVMCGAWRSVVWCGAVSSSSFRSYSCSSSCSSLLLFFVLFLSSQVLEAEPLRRLKISTFLRDQLQAAANVHGPDFQAAMSSLGEGLSQQLQTVLAAAG